MRYIGGSQIAREKNSSEAMSVSGINTRREIRELYYITHVSNISSIVNNGILSHKEIIERKVPFTPIYDKEIVSLRANKTTPIGKSLWEYANVYFQPRNAMMYRVTLEKDKSDIAVIGVKRRILSEQGAFVTDGNAANSDTKFYSQKEIQRILPMISKETNKEWWNAVDGSKRKMMAECLIPELIPTEYIEEIIVANREVAQRVRSTSDVDVVTNAEMFFEPSRRSEITERLSILDGDMFFSRMQTLTVSVNIVGVMGKGLASRAKYQFPDVYVKYQDVCRRKSLTMGRPFFYRRESSLDYELADEPSTLTNGNGETWFVLFPTKRHWRENADINAIEEGLKQIVEKYRFWEIKSLALPALGCGLGGLDWKDVGPLICKYMSQLNIPVQVYLPAERHIPDSQILKDFLLPGRL